MERETIIEKYKLTEDEMNYIVIREFNKLRLLIRGIGNNFEIIGGQSGAGKSELVASKYKELDNNAIIINIDELRRTHPKYQEAYDLYHQEVYGIFAGYVSELVDGILRLSMDNHYNVIFEVALQNKSGLLKYIERFNSKGYNSILNVLATPALESKISIFQRYCQQLEIGIEPRFVNQTDASVENIVKTTMELYDMKICSDIKVYVRGEKRKKAYTNIFTTRDANYNTEGSNIIWKKYFIT